jgi:hypothetical protein
MFEVHEAPIADYDPGRPRMHAEHKVQFAAEQVQDAAPAKSWRDILPVHPAANEFPRISPEELRELGKDILKNGLTSPIVLWSDGKSQAQLLDGISRLDAIEMVAGPVTVGAPSILAGADFFACDKVIVLDKSVDPYTFVISANVHRRHLDAEDRAKRLAAAIARSPEKSDRQLGKELGVDHKTIAHARAKGEDVGSIPHVETRTDTKGRAQPAKRTRNLARGPIHRAMELGEDVMVRIKGTSLDDARELDELIVLNRGAVPGTLTDIVQELVAAAAAGVPVSAVGYVRSGGAYRRDPIAAKAAEPTIEALEHLTASQLVDALEKRLHRDGIEAPVQLRKIRNCIEQSKPHPQLELVANPAADKPAQNVITRKDGARAFVDDDVFREYKQMPLADLENLILKIQRAAGDGTHLTPAQWNKLDRMRDRAAELKRNPAAPTAAHLILSDQKRSSPNDVLHPHR